MASPLADDNDPPPGERPSSTAAAVDARSAGAAKDSAAEDPRLAALRARDLPLDEPAAESTVALDLSRVDGASTGVLPFVSVDEPAPSAKVDPEQELPHALPFRNKHEPPTPSPPPEPQPEPQPEPLVAEYTPLPEPEMLELLTPIPSEQTAAVDEPPAEPTDDSSQQAPPKATAADLSEPPTLPVDAYPIERCARILASAHARPDAIDEILDEQDLPPETWQQLREHWQAQVSASLKRGQQQLMRAQDSAYVEQLEVERGPLLATEYALLCVAAERGTQREVCQQLRLPPPAVMPVQRRMIRRMTEDIAFASEVRASIGRQRG